MTQLLKSVLLATALLSMSVAQAQGSAADFTSFAGSSLGSGTLTDIQKKFGEAPLVESGDAGEYVASVCYKSRSGYAAFLAGELDGPDHELGGYWLSLAPARPPCLKWSEHIAFPDLSLGPLHLEMTLDEFKKNAGTSVRWVKHWAYVDFEGRRKLDAAEIARLPPAARQAIKDGSNQDYFHVVVSVSARFSAGKLTDLRVWKSETM